MNSIFKKSLSVISSVAILAASGIIGVNAYREPAVGEPVSHFWDFDSADDLKDFVSRTSWMFADYGELITDNLLGGDSPTWRLVNDDTGTYLQNAKLHEGDYTFGPTPENPNGYSVATNNNLALKQKQKYFDATITFKLDPENVSRVGLGYSGRNLGNGGWDNGHPIFFGPDGSLYFNVNGIQAACMPDEVANGGTYTNTELGVTYTKKDGDMMIRYADQKDGNGASLEADGKAADKQALRVRVEPAASYPNDDGKFRNFRNYYHLTVWANDVKVIDHDIFEESNSHFSEWDTLSVSFMNGVMLDSLKVDELDESGNARVETATPSSDAPGELIAYDYDFTDAADLDDFKAYYRQPDAGAPGGTEDPRTGYVLMAPAVWSDFFTLDTDAGTLSRKKLLEENPGTAVNGNITLNKRLQYFEAELDFTFGDSWGWTVLAFNQQKMGAHHAFESNAVFMDMQGGVYVQTANLAVGTEFGGNSEVRFPAEANTPYREGFVKNADGVHHTITVRYEPTVTANQAKLTVWVTQSNDNQKIQVYEGIYENILYVDNGGFLSVQTQNDTMKINRLTVKPLDENGNYLYNPLDKSELQALINSAETNADGKYTPESFEAYANAILAGQTALTEATTQQQIEGAIAEIERTYGLLDLADKTAWDYVYDFESDADMSAFNAYGIDNGTGQGTAAAWSDLWELRDGKLVRKTTSGVGVGTGEKNAMLYLKQPLRFFEAEIQMEFGDVWGWLQFGFGAQEMGWHAENREHPSAGFFLERECYLHARIPNFSAGDTQVWGGNMSSYWGGTVDETHNNLKPGIHTFRVIVEPSENPNKILVTLKVKSESNNNEEFVALDKQEFEAPILANNDGYFYIQAQNDNSTINSVKIREIETPATTTTSEATTTTSEATTTTSEATTTTSEATTTTSEATTTTSEATTTTEDSTTTTQPAQPDDRFDYVYDFDSEEDLADFEAYWQAVRDSADGFNSGVAEDVTVHWEIKDGKLVRKELVTGSNPGTDSNNAMLYLATEKIPYFEAELTFNHGDSWGWPQLNFGSSALGEPVLRSGAGVFMSQEGQMYISRFVYNEEVENYVSSDVTVSERPYGEGFEKVQSHTYKIRVVKGEKENETLLSIWVKQADGEFVEIAKDFSIIDPEMAAKGGYIFLQAQNDNISFDSLKIQKLNADGSDWTEDTENTTNPSTDSTTTTPDTDVTTTTSPETTTDSGSTNPPATGVTVALTSVVLLAGSAAALVVTKKRRS